MRWTRTMLILAAFAVAAAAPAQGAAEAASGPQQGARSGVVFSVQGMTCGSCQDRIRNELGSRPGVFGVAVDLLRSRVAVAFDAAAVDPKDLADRLTHIGYPARYVGPGPADIRTAGPGQTSGGCGGGCCQTAQRGT